MRPKTVGYFDDGEEHVAGGDTRGRLRATAFPAEKQCVDEDSGGVEDAFATLVPLESKVNRILVVRDQSKHTRRVGS